MKKALILILIVVLTAVVAYMSTVKAEKNTIADLGYSVSQFTNPIKDPNFKNYKTATFTKPNVDPKLLHGTIVSQPIDKLPDEKTLKSPQFYKQIFQCNVINSGYIDTNSYAAKIEQPYANVFYIYDTSHNINRRDYVVIFVINTKEKTVSTYIFSILPQYMNEAVHSTLLPVINRFKIVSS